MGKDVDQAIVELTRLGMAGRPQDVMMYARRLAKKLNGGNKGLVDQLTSLLASPPSISSPLRDAGGEFIPVDTDSRLQLVRFEHPVVLDHAPILSGDIQEKVQQVIEERANIQKLHAKGLFPCRSVVMTGEPGVGKTLTARYLASMLKLPILTLDLSTVMSSFLGKTGSNIRNVLDYAKSHQCVLLLDEFDAIAKKRDDLTEVGELKRLVTVLLQEIDDWTGESLLVAATNHRDLVDPAVWRRFDVAIEFPERTDTQLDIALPIFFDQDWGHVAHLRKILTACWRGWSYADVERHVSQLRRRAAVRDLGVEDVIAESLSQFLRDQPLEDRKVAALELIKVPGLSDRKIHSFTGVSRNILKKLRENS